MQITYQLGALPDTHDARDRTVSQLSLPTPSNGDILLPRRRKVRRQVGGSCVANAVCNVLEISADIHGAKCPDLAEQYLYQTSRWVSQREMHDWKITDEGTRPRNAFYALGLWGVPSVDVAPANLATLNEEPTGLAKAHAAEWRARVGGTAYHRANSLADVDAALAVGMPVVACFRVGAEWFSHDGSTPLQYPTRDVGGHAVAIIGRMSGSYIFLNSWGYEWGDEGLGVLSPTYARTFFDAWTGVTQWQ